MKYLTKITIFISVILFQITSFESCNNSSSEKTSQTLIIFHAGSLSVPFKEISKEFRKLHPNVTIELEAAGSRKCARKITDLKRDCDIMASADYTVIDKLLIPEYADWNIKFATNEMAIVYNDKSRYNNIINKENWFDILLKANVAYGRSEPNSDPCGYRAVLTTKLAEVYYNKHNLASNILLKDNKYIRPKETDLLALLETNAIDYIFLYRSVAQQHGLKYLILPDEINLKNSNFNNRYSKATTKISGKESGETITKKGQAMVYGITILKNAPHKQLAIDFLEFLLQKDKGIKIMEQNGQPSAIPSYSKEYKKIPDNLKKFVLKSEN